MACQRPGPIVTFEQDIPEVIFHVTSDGEPFRFNNTASQLHVITSDGAHVAQFCLLTTGLGVLNFNTYCAQGLEAFYENLYKLVPGTNYRAQIYICATNPEGEGLGLYDIVEPYWSDYIPPTELDDPPAQHVVGWFSGEERQDQTVLTTFPWEVREAFKLRGN